MTQDEKTEVFRLQTKIIKELEEENEMLKKTEHGLRLAINKLKQRTQKNNNDLNPILIEYLIRKIYNKDKDKEMLKLFITWRENNTELTPENLQRKFEELEEQYHHFEILEVKLKGDYLEYKISCWL